MTVEYVDRPSQLDDAWLLYDRSGRLITGCYQGSHGGPFTCYEDVLNEVGWNDEDGELYWVGPIGGPVKLHTARVSYLVHVKVSTGEVRYVSRVDLRRDCEEFGERRDDAKARLRADSAAYDESYVNRRKRVE